MANAGYEVRYENGASHTMHAGLASSLDQAIEISRESILGCMPEGFNIDNLVRPVIARSLSVCALCGSKAGLTIIELPIGIGCRICDQCIGIISCVVRHRSLGR